MNVNYLDDMCYFCTANKRLEPEAPIFANICKLTRYLRLPIFIPIVDVLDLPLKGQRFESSTLGNSNVIISQTVTYRANIAIANTKSRMWPFDWHIYI